MTNRFTVCARPSPPTVRQPHQRSARHPPSLSALSVRPGTAGRYGDRTVVPLALSPPGCIFFSMLVFFAAVCPGQHHCARPQSVGPSARDRQIGYLAPDSARRPPASMRSRCCPLLKQRLDDALLKTSWPRSPTPRRPGRPAHPRDSADRARAQCRRHFLAYGGQIGWPIRPVGPSDRPTGHPLRERQTSLEHTRARPHFLDIEIHLMAFTSAENGTTLSASARARSCSCRQEPAHSWRPCAATLRQRGPFYSS